MVFVSLCPPLSKKHSPFSPSSCAFDCPSHVEAGRTRPRWRGRRRRCCGGAGKKKTNWMRKTVSGAARFCVSCLPLPLGLVPHRAKREHGHVRACEREGGAAWGKAGASALSHLVTDGSGAPGIQRGGTAGTGEGGARRPGVWEVDDARGRCARVFSSVSGGPACEKYFLQRSDPRAVFFHTHTQNAPVPFSTQPR